APREPTPVAASFAKTWDAAIDAFAARNIPIRSVERASGFIAAEPAIATDDANADCGSSVIGERLSPERAVYNVIVRGDSTRSTVRVTARWTAVYGEGRDALVEECSTTGRWEAELEAQIKARAEREAAGY
ncbi:MAG TPA: hypothetical protein VNA89_09285, partial [Gemmatimonadaceae bacterium]|nr:hypothetical protein [Gemmatimonadaceae bacterium]